MYWTMKTRKPLPKARHARPRELVVLPLPSPVITITSPRRRLLLIALLTQLGANSRARAGRALLPKGDRPLPAHWPRLALRRSAASQPRYPRRGKLSGTRPESEP